MSKLNSKRFVLRKSLVGQNQIIEVTFKNGNQVTYNHDKVYEIMKDKLETMNCWEKYKSYTSSNSLPVIVRDNEMNTYFREQRRVLKNRYTENVLRLESQKVYSNIIRYS